MCMLAVIVVQVQNDQCVRIAECCKDIKGHLGTCSLSESSLNSEATLLLARAGIFNEEKKHSNLIARHRNEFGPRWRSNRKTCSCPNSWAAHRKANVRRKRVRDEPKGRLATTSFNDTFQQTFSPGEFVDVSKEGHKTSPQKSSDEQTLLKVSETTDVDTGVGVFQCPNEGCIKVYRRYSAPECELHPEKAALLDKAKQLYHVKLTEGTSAGATSHPN